MKVKFKDRSTGQEAWFPFGMDIYWWSEGNGACDCNRMDAFDGIAFTGCRSERFIAIDLELETGDSSCAGRSKESLLAEINDNYE